MLTEAEHQWLAEREWTLAVMGSYSCCLCQYRDPDDLLCIFRTCPKFTDNWRDAAEFAARVAVYLAKSPCLTCPSTIYGNCETRKTARGREVIEACRLKHARLTAETEMEAESAER